MSYRIPEKTIETIMVLYKNKKTMAQPPDGDTNFFDVLAGVPQSDIRCSFLFILPLDYVLRTSVDHLNETSFTQKMKFFTVDFFSKCNQIRSFQRILSHLLEKSKIGNFIFCAVALQKSRNRRYPTETITDVDYAGELAFITDKIGNAENYFMCLKMQNLRLVYTLMQIKSNACVTTRIMI